jgi:S-DNA-T family DNA segregation ATPase FtsK/SpoIIIE
MDLVITVVAPPVAGAAPTDDGAAPDAGPMDADVSMDLALDVLPTTTIEAVIAGVTPQLAAVGCDLPMDPHGFAPLVELYLGERRLDARSTVGECGLVSGSRLGIGAPAPSPDDQWSPGDERTDWLEVHAVGGPLSGRVWPVSPGAHGIGSAPDCAIQLAGDDDVPEWGLLLTVSHTGDAWLSGESLAAARFATPAAPRPPKPDAPDPNSGPPDPDPDPTAEPEQRPWPLGVDVAIGDSLLRLVERCEPDAALAPSEDVIGRDFNRPPRLVPPLLQTRERLPAIPRRPGRRPLPLLVSLSPLLMGAVFLYFFKSPYFLVLMALSPIISIASWISQRRQGRRTFREESARYRVRRAAARRRLFEQVSTERLARCDATPDPAALGLVASGPSSRLWERRRSDPDYLVLRVGTVDQPSLLEVEDPEFEDHQRRVRWNIPDLPCVLDVTQRGVVGLVGDDATARGVTRWLLAQAAILHSPRDLRVVVLTDRAGEECWEWVRWLPHARSPGPARPGDPVAMVGNDPETVARRVSDLQTLVRARLKARGSSMGRIVFAEPDVLVLLDGARRLRDVPGMVQVLAEGPAVRVFAVCLDARERLLPEECTAVVHCDADGLTVRQSDTPDVEEVRPDLVTPAWCDHAARGMSSLRDVTPDEDDGLPTLIRLLELLGLDDQRPPDPARIVAAWSFRPASTGFVIGAGFDGPIGLDLVTDGPHALIAGTTGSGKSELLQTLVASLAVANRPDELVFVLVDYKGGSAFQHCEQLPHTLGMVTDLDGALAGRALESLGAELRRRETMLAAARAKDLPHYRSLRAKSPDLPALPRLVLIIDEFASLVREIPGFIPGLVSLAQRGRSLGIHLVLASQRPAGVITSDIRANTNLRIALRVTDPGESSDVIDTKDAAFISAATPGRALVRLAHQLVVPFQTAYVGGSYQRDDPADAEAKLAQAPVEAASLSWLGLGRPAPLGRGRTAPGAFPGEEDETRETELDVLVDTVRAAAELSGYQRQPSPWLPPLGYRVLLADLMRQVGPVRPAATSPRLPPVPYALEDLPALQRQLPVMCDLATFGHLFVLGAPRSGRSQVLRTLTGALGDVLSPADLHLYVIDTGGALAVLAELPHCGAVVLAADLERVGRLLERLAEELGARQGLLARHSCTGLDELRAALPPEERPAHVMLLVDGWDGLANTLLEYNGGGLYELLLGLLREGDAVGIHLVLTSERGLLTGRAGGLSDHRLMLRMADRGDFNAIRVPGTRIPDYVPPGRAWRSVNQAELQVAVLTDDLSGQGQADALRRIAARARARHAGVPPARQPFPVSALPASVTFADAFATVPAADRRPLLALLGVGGNEMSPVMVDFGARAYTFLVGGPPGSGRSTTLATLAVSLLAGGTRLVLVTPRESPLRRLATHDGVRLVDGPSPAAAEVTEAVSEGGPVVVLVDDADLLGLGSPVDAPLRAIVAAGRDRGIGLAYAASAESLTQTFSGWMAEAKRSRQGVLLAPQSAVEGDLLGSRVPPSMLRAGVQPGRGHIVDGKGTIRVVALPHTVIR